MTLHTLGYQLYDPPELWRLCDLNRVDLVVDVRRSAVSQKPGWNGAELAADARYQHIPGLGNRVGAVEPWGPSSWPEAEAALTVLYDRIMRGETLLLLCAEQAPCEVDWQGHLSIYCHRYEIARLLRERTGCEVRHQL